ncbi:MAG: hypothetical protein BWX72_00494 [Firmicutes bacterium ADurb.Bin080]|nr:MAG: hypothetical protein BWX72_00494 [Firmicutes bacterium ADurb.Bin080]
MSLIAIGSSLDKRRASNPAITSLPRLMDTASGEIITCIAIAAGLSRVAYLATLSKLNRLGTLPAVGDGDSGEALIAWISCMSLEALLIPKLGIPKYSNSRYKLLFFKYMPSIVGFNGSLLLYSLIAASEAQISLILMFPTISYPRSSSKSDKSNCNDKPSTSPASISLI